MSLSTREPKRNTAGLIEPEEYQHLVGMELPDMEVEVTSFLGIHKKDEFFPIEKISLRTLVGNKGFIMAYQPGASTDEEATKKMYSTKAGAMGCGSELVALDTYNRSLLWRGYSTIIIISTKTSAQQQQVFKDKVDASKLGDKDFYFISDVNGELAKHLGLYMNSDSLRHPDTGDTVNINFIERVMTWGKNATIAGYNSAAQMGVVADFVKEKLLGQNGCGVLPYVNQNLPQHSPRHFQPAAAPVTGVTTSEKEKEQQFIPKR